MMKSFIALALSLAIQTSLHAAPQDLFKKTASSLVACYEKFGVLQDSYTEEGLCTQDSDLSAWTLQAENPIQFNITKVESLESFGAVRYSGLVKFQNADGAPCSFTLNFLYSGEDITADVSGFNCQAR